MGPLKPSLLAAGLLASALGAHAAPEAINARAHAAIERAEAGGQWQHAINDLLAVLEASGPGTEGERLAIEALARHGDGQVVAPMVRAAQRSPETRARVAEALPRLIGRHPTRAMAYAFEDAAPEDQVLLLAAMRDREAPIVLPAMIAGLESRHAAVRDAALETMSTRTDQAAVLQFAALLADPGPLDAEVVRRASADLRDSIVASGDPTRIGYAHLLGFHLAEDDAGRREALAAMAAHPVAESLEVVRAALRDDSLSDAAAPAAVHAANGLVQQRRMDEAAALVRDAASATGRAAPDAGSVPESLGFLSNGWIAGPLRAETFEAGWEEPWAGEPRTRAIDPPAAPPLDWRPFDARATGGIVDFIAEFGQQDDCFAYVFVRFESDHEGPAQLRIGSDDGVAAWLNDRLVHEHRTFRGVLPDNDIAPIELVEGTNTLLLKISQGAAGWGFCVRLTDPDGWPIATTTEATR